MKRRSFLKSTFVSSAGMLAASSMAQTEAADIHVLNPRNRIPINFIIDDSTALVNLAHYGIPQFKQTFPEQYKQDWRKLPREIPDSFVEEFLGWCKQHGVKGKYSMVPYPACTGWLNRFIPGWSQEELKKSIKLVRDMATPDWDIHSEMISHTRVIDIKTGLPFPKSTPDYMENWDWSQTRSADELGEYIGYSLKILREVGFDCDGVTTPGGFGSRNISNLALGTKYAVQDVFGHSVAHFFRDVILDPKESVYPDVMHVSGLDSGHAQCSVHMKACTGDWFGGWDGLTPGDADRFITSDGSQGRMVEVIAAGGPAIFICHWPGIYYNGEKLGFNIFKTVVQRLEEYYDNLHWMKLTDIAHYWAAKEYTQFEQIGKSLKIHAPFKCSDFTFSLPNTTSTLSLRRLDGDRPLQNVAALNQLTTGSYSRESDRLYVCMDLERGLNTLVLES